jgi:hypothetical protein
MNAAGLAMLEAESFEQAQSQPLIEFIAPAYRAAFAFCIERSCRATAAR